jgi:hypothetical protein
VERGEWKVWAQVLYAWSKSISQQFCRHFECFFLTDRERKNVSRSAMEFELLKDLDTIFPSAIAAAKITRSDDGGIEHGVYFLSSTVVTSSVFSDRQGKKKCIEKSSEFEFLKDLDSFQLATNARMFFCFLLFKSPSS